MCERGFELDLGRNVATPPRSGSNSRDGHLPRLFGGGNLSGRVVCTVK